MKRAMSRTMKLLHTAGTVGLAGAVACYLVLLQGAPEPTAIEAYAAVREGIARICRWLLLPSMLAVLTSGLLAMAIHRPFLDKRWAWLKAALGIVVFKATLGVQAPAERGEALSLQALAGEVDAAALPTMIRDEAGTLWVLLALSLANIVLGIWRPRLRRRRAGAASDPRARGSEPRGSDSGARTAVLGDSAGARDAA